jgi:hypothetical protein
MATFHWSVVPRPVPSRPSASMVAPASSFKEAAVAVPPVLRNDPVPVSGTPAITLLPMATSAWPRSAARRSHGDAPARRSGRQRELALRTVCLGRAATACLAARPPRRGIEVDQRRLSLHLPRRVRRAALRPPGERGTRAVAAAPRAARCATDALASTFGGFARRTASRELPRELRLQVDARLVDAAVEVAAGCLERAAQHHGRGASVELRRLHAVQRRVDRPRGRRPATLRVDPSARERLAAELGGELRDVDRARVVGARARFGDELAHRQPLLAPDGRGRRLRARLAGERRDGALRDSADRSSACVRACSSPSGQVRRDAARRAGPRLLGPRRLRLRARAPRACGRERSVERGFGTPRRRVAVAGCTTCTCALTANGGSAPMRAEPLPCSVSHASERSRRDAARRARAQVQSGTHVAQRRPPSAAMHSPARKAPMSS